MDIGRFKIMWENDEVVDVYYAEERFEVTQNTNHVKRVFFKDDNKITKDDLIRFLEYQLFDAHNARQTEILSSLGLVHYNIWELVKLTRAISCRNNFWVKFENDNLDYYEDIKTGKFIKFRGWS